MRIFFIAFLSGFLFLAAIPEEGFSNFMPSRQVDTVYYIPGQLKHTARLFSDKENMSSVVLYIPADTTVQIIRAEGDYFYVHFHNIEGYILQTKISNYPDILYELRQPVTGNVTRQSQIDDNRYDMLIHKYGRETGKKIYEHKIWRGMDREMVLNSWGKPHIINRYYDKEEWIYKTHVLVFRHGYLSSMYERTPKSKHKR